MNNAHRRTKSLRLVAFATIAVALSPFIATTRARAIDSAPTKHVQDVGAQQPGIAYERTVPMRNDLDAIEAAGMTWVRADFYWYSIQSKGPNSWNWGPTDAFVKAARAHHLHVLGMLAYTPAWARKGGNDYYGPKNPADFANFARAVAKRYTPMGVHAWEIWNEPNLAMFWAPKADPIAYAALLRAAYPAIHGVDHQATVVSGGLAPASDNGTDLSATSFLVGIYYHGAKNDFDALGLHPYSYPYAPMYPASWNTFYTTPDLHKLMASVGDSKKQIWGTEIGYPTGTGPKSVSDSRQADDLVAAITAWRKWPFTGPLFIFQLRDSSANKAQIVGNMGLLRWDGKPKPAYVAIRRELG